MIDILPPWNKAIARWLEPLSPFARLVLIAIALLILLAALYLDVEYQLLLIAFLISP